MFLDIMEPRTKKLKFDFRIIWAHICGIIASIVHKMISKKFVLKFGPKGDKFLRYVICDAIYTCF